MFINEKIVVILNILNLNGIEIKIHFFSTEKYNSSSNMTVQIVMKKIFYPKNKLHTYNTNNLIALTERLAEKYLLWKKKCVIVEILNFKTT